MIRTDRMARGRGEYQIASTGYRPQAGHQALRLPLTHGGKFPERIGCSVPDQVQMPGRHHVTSPMIEFECR